MKAEGKWAWWNQYGSVSVDKCIDRAKEAGLDGVIVKVSYPRVQEQFQRADIVVATEEYCLPIRPKEHGTRLASAVQNGAKFAAINAEVEWERAGQSSGAPMETLIGTFRDIHPSIELYASVDTRGNRTLLPYQRILAEHIVGWMPMIYPLSFYHARQQGWIAQAFKDCLDTGQRWDDIPVLPTIQTYDNIGKGAVELQIRECEDRKVKGYQAYTICHATDEEWAVIVGDSSVVEEDDKDMAWLDGVIVGYGGRPIVFEVLSGDTTRKTTLTRKEYITFSALRWIVSPHTHKVEVSLV